MKQKQWTMILALALCFAVAAPSVRAETSGGYTFVLHDGGTAAITKYTGSDAVLVIPAELDGHKVTAIGEGAFSGCQKLISVTIPDGVTVIGDFAFASCVSLTDVTVPDSVTDIGMCSFYGCLNLTLTVSKGSPAERYCAAYGIPCAYADPAR